ncbi:MAG: hypothetical protein ACREBE_21220 [bacterium]
MRRLRASITLLLLAIAAAPAAAFGQADKKTDVTGQWLFIVTTDAGTGTPTITFKQQGDSLTGHSSSQTLGEAELKGTLKDGKITVRVGVEVQGQALTVVYAGTMDGNDAMKGTLDLGGMASGTFTAKRQP